MQKIKLVAAVIILASFLSFGSPVITRASGMAAMPPAVVLTQDRSSRMLVKHNFKYDQRIFVPGDTEQDPGFYVDFSNNQTAY